MKETDCHPLSQSQSSRCVGSRGTVYVGFRVIEDQLATHTVSRGSNMGLSN